MSFWHDLVPDDCYVDINGDSSACFSRCTLYRPVLERQVSVEGSGSILWIGMNPSTADAYKNDPTVKREIDFSKRWGYARYIKMNVCDYRSTDPKGMLQAVGGARSAANLPLILELAARCDRIVLCHGLLPRQLQPLALECQEALKANRLDLWCLGTTKAGQPKHPLYLRADAPLVRFY